jgi:hypothetical protein
LKSDIVIPTELLFLLRIALIIQASLCFHTNFRIDLCIYVKDNIGILMEIALKPQIAFSSIVICKILILLIHEHGRSFHLLVFLNDLKLLCSQLDTWLHMREHGNMQTFCWHLVRNQEGPTINR